jgi:hypothetical protein
MTRTGGILRVSYFPVSGDARCEQARAVEYTVFKEAFGDTREVMDREYRPYEDRSAFITLAEGADAVLGVCRLIFPDAGEGGLKSVDDIDRGPWGVSASDHLTRHGLRRGFDIATISVLRQAESAATFLASRCLFHAIYSIARTGGWDHSVGILDATILRYLRAYGIPITTIGGARPARYLGSTRSLPCAFDWSEVAAAVAAGTVRGDLGTGAEIRREVGFPPELPMPPVATPAVATLPCPDPRPAT